MTTRWTRRAILQTGGAALAGMLPAPPAKLTLPRPVKVGILGLEWK